MDKETEFKAKMKTLAVKLGIIEEPVIESKFEEVVLADESIVQIDPAVEVGATVSIDVEGELQAVPDETYTLSDGRKIVVVGGKIESLEEVAEEEVEEEMETAKDTLTAEDVKSIIDALGFSKLVEDLESTKNEFKAYVEKTEANEIVKGEAIVEAFKSLGDKPREEVKKKKNNFLFKEENRLETILNKINK